MADRRVFISYSHADRKWPERLQVHLRPLIRDSTADIWDDTRIKAGDAWQTEIRKALEAASVAVLLISADFLASDFVQSEELPALLKAAEERGLLILQLTFSPVSASNTHSVQSSEAETARRTFALNATSFNSHARCELKRLQEDAELPAAS